MRKLAVVFPGVRYNEDKPLLYYSIKAAMKYGYEVKCIHYENVKLEDLKENDEKRRKAIDEVIDCVDNNLQDVSSAEWDEVLFIGKSIGTVAAGAYAESKGIKARFILFTPICETFDYRFEDAIVFNGTLDDFNPSSLIKKKCDEQGIRVYITPYGNHSLDIMPWENGCYIHRGDEIQVDDKSDITDNESSNSVTGSIKELARIITKVERFIAESDNPNLKQCLNPYLPSNEYIPDGEPYVFGDRVYVYGSHDMFGGDVYCMLDYVCWSAPISDLSNWRFEGIIYRVDQDPDNKNISGKLYAPDVAKGPDGRYYLYYAINNQNHISVAVCDHPGGHYEFYGYVHYKDGTRLGDLPSDEMQFDPGVLCEDDKVYLFTGFCPIGQEDRHGPMLTVLGPDMITIEKAPKFIAPSEPYSRGSGYEGHEFFEAPSIRKINGIYTFIYSSILFHELCYAQSIDPEGPYEYKGVIVSNGDLHIDSYKDAEKCAFFCANNHGSIEKIGDDWYVFYHRHTNGNNYCRQGCFEKLEVSDDGVITQAMMTSCNSLEPLKATGSYPTYIACNLYTEEDATYVPWTGWMSDSYPKITQSGWDNEDCPAYITNMTNGTTAGFKYFDFKGVTKITVCTKGYGNGIMEIRLSPRGEVVGGISITSQSVWKRSEGVVNIPDGVSDLFFTFKGSGWCAFREFTFN